MTEPYACTLPATESRARYKARLGFKANVLEQDHPFVEARARFLRESKLPDPGLALWIVETCVRAAFHQAFAERPKDANSDVLVDEIVRLVVPFLKG